MYPQITIKFTLITRTKLKTQICHINNKIRKIVLGSQIVEITDHHKVLLEKCILSVEVPLKKKTGIICCRPTGVTYEENQFSN